MTTLKIYGQENSILLTEQNADEVKNFFKAWPKDTMIKVMETGEVLKISDIFDMDIQYRHINLSNGLCAMVDNEDFKHLSQYNWHLLRGKSTFYAFRNQRHYRILMHTEIMNPAKGLIVHHKDGNGLNNQRSNLQICTHKEHRKTYKLK